MTVPFSEEDVYTKNSYETKAKLYFDKDKPAKTKSDDHKKEHNETKSHDHREKPTETKSDEPTETKSYDHSEESPEAKPHDHREEPIETKPHDDREEKSRRDSDCDTLCSNINSKQTVDNSLTNNVLVIINTNLLKMLFFAIWHSLFICVDKITANAVQLVKYYYAYNNVKVKIKLTSGDTTKLYEKQNGNSEWIFDWLIRPLQYIHQIVIKTYPFFPKDYNSFLKEGQNTNISYLMQFEASRFATFSTFPASVGVYATRLAAAGFYYNGNGDEVVCFKCGATYRNWKKHDSAKEIHKRISPECSFVMENEKGANNIMAGACGTTNNIVAGAGGTTNNILAGACGTPRDLLLTARKSPSSDICTEDASQSKVHPSNNTESLFLPTKPTNNSIVTNNLTHTNKNESNNEIPERNELSENDMSSLVRIPQSNTVLRYVPSASKSANTDIVRSPPINNNTNGSSESQTMGICLDKPKYPKYAIRATRLESFKNWPYHLSQRPEEMTLAGLFFTGTEDHCRCFFCGGGLKNWETDDQPWVEHARWYQHCAFVLHCKGSKFVEDVQMNRYMPSQPTPTPSTQETVNKHVTKSPPESNKQPTRDEFTNHPAVLSVVELGYSWNIIKNAFQSLKSSNSGKRNEITAAILLDAVFQLEECSENMSTSQDDHVNHNKQTEVTTNESKAHAAADLELEMSMKSLEEENQNLRDQQTCKICLDEAVAIVFLPCGHMASCVNCAPALRRCPICRTFIKGTVKAIMC